MLPFGDAMRCMGAGAAMLREPSRRLHSRMSWPVSKGPISAATCSSAAASS